MSNTFILIAAVAQNSCIGQGGALPWRLPADMAHFKALTTGKTVLMGRKTWDSLPAAYKPLPNRRNLVLTRQGELNLGAGVEVITSLAQVPAGEIWVLGGAELYSLTLPLAERLELTEVHTKVAGDAFFPALDKTQWQQETRTPNPGNPAFDFVTYVRNNGSSQ